MRRISTEDLREGSGKRRPMRTSQEVLREYEEKYAPLLHAHEANDRLTVEEIRSLEVGEGMAQMSLGGTIYEATVAEAMEASVQMHINKIVRAAVGSAASVVDLGCGYGYLLARLRPLLGRGVELRGGEFSPSAVALAEWLHRGDDLLTVERFDFHSARYEPLEKAPAPCVVVTSFALHQLATAAPVIEVLSRYREKIAAAVTLEPEEDLLGETKLGQMRLRYQLAHDYSADLWTCLRERDDVEIEEVVPNAVGANALLPGTLARWRFR